MKIRAPRSAAICFAVVTSLFFFVCSASLRAATNVSGVVGVATTWSAANAPYTVTGNIQVPAGSTLTIEPGVEVRYAGAYEIYVVGAVVANGTASAPIKFKSLTAGTSSGATMLKFEGANLNNTQLSHVQFSDANRAILVGGGDGSGSTSSYQGVACTGTLTVSDVTVTNAQVRTGGYNTTAKLLLTNATVTNATIFGQYPLSEPIELRDSTVTNSVITSHDYNLGITLTNTAMSGGQILLGCCGSSVTIKSGSTVINAAISEFNTGGKLTIDGATLTNTTINLPTNSCAIANSTITFGSGVTPMVRFALGTVTGSTITGSGSGTGLHFTDSPGSVTVTGTAISNFAVGLKFASGRTSGTLVVTGNQFSNNATYNLEHRSSLPIDGLGNNWGTTDAYATAQKIYDKNDDSNIGLLKLIDPALLTITSHPVNATVSVLNSTTFTVSATGSTALSYQWYRNGCRSTGRRTPRSCLRKFKPQPRGPTERW